MLPASLHIYNSKKQAQRQGGAQVTVSYGINIVSNLHAGLRWSLRPPGCFFASPQAIIQEVLDIGYDGVQAIPLWDMTGQEEGIILSQGPWNAVPSPWAALRHEKGSLGVESQIQDWIVSPPIETCNRIVDALIGRSIPRIYHDFEDEIRTSKSYIEVHPGLRLSPKEIFEQYQERGMKVALDLWHLRRDHRDDEIARWSELENKPSCLGIAPEEWLETIDILAPLIKVIHVQPSEELERFATDPRGTLTEMLLVHALWRVEQIAPEREIMLVAEYNPDKKRLAWPPACRKLAAQMLVAMQECVKTAA